VHGTWWSIEAHLLDDVRMALVHTKKRAAQAHPARPTGRIKRALDPIRLAAARRRRRLRQRAIERGDIT
jgi:hypothetical protein